jgi:hypothetical protein
MQYYNPRKSLNQKKHKIYHVVISEVNYQKLKSLGKMGDTFDSILSRILDRVEKRSEESKK